MPRAALGLLVVLVWGYARSAPEGGAGHVILVPPPPLMAPQRGPATSSEDAQGVKLIARPNARRLQSGGACSRLYVNGFDTQDYIVGYYEASGTCDGRTMYTSTHTYGSYTFYVRYNPDQGGYWMISASDCGESSAVAYGIGSVDDPSDISTWYEWTGSQWSTSAQFEVACVAISSVKIK